MHEQYQNKIIRLASIDAAEQTVTLPENIVLEKEEILKKLKEVKMITIVDGKFTFVDNDSNDLYQASFQNF